MKTGYCCRSKIKTKLPLYILPDIFVYISYRFIAICTQNTFFSGVYLVNSTNPNLKLIIIQPSIYSIIKSTIISSAVLLGLGKQCYSGR